MGVCVLKKDVVSGVGREKDVGILVAFSIRMNKNLRGTSHGKRDCEELIDLHSRQQIRKHHNHGGMIGRNSIPK